jgi:(S)-2-hydroxyglutarate dehydrogenase
LIPKNITVIGGGIVGLATAYRFGEKFPDAYITVLEKENTVGRHQSGNNSGVLHAGIYYKPGSVKAKLAVRGIRQMIQFCQQHAIPYEVCGKLVVASTQEELSRLQDLFERGQQNGLKDLKMLSPEQMKEIEPHVAGVAAIRVPEEGIVDYGRVCAVLAQQVHGRVVTSANVTKIRRNGAWIVETSAGEFQSDVLVNCAGLQCDRVSEMAGLKRELRIVPFRGEYYKLRPESQYLVRNLIYPVPDPKFPFLGVHFTRLIHGGIEAGPNAVLAFAREGYRKSDIKLKDIIDAVSYSGLWAFLKKYPRMCFDELKRSFSKDLFCRSLQKLVPEIRVEDLETGGAGVRAQALTPNGEMVQDFYIQRYSNSVHVLNAPSPGATASLAIGEEILNYLELN